MIKIFFSFNKFYEAYTTGIYMYGILMKKISYALVNNLNVKSY